MKRIVIADDHKSYRIGLQTMLESFADYRVVATAADGAEALKCIEQHKPDLLLLDIHMPVMDGFDVIEMLKKKKCKTKSLVVTTLTGTEVVLKVQRAGANGILCKTFTEHDLQEAIEGINKLPFYIGADCSPVAVTKLKGKNGNASELVPARQELDEREVLILQMIAEEKNSEDMGKELYLSPRTVEGIRKKMMEKTNTHSALGLLRYGLQKGLIKF